MIDLKIYRQDVEVPFSQMSVQQLTKEHHYKQIYHNLRMKDCLSRSELSHLLHVSATAGYSLVDDMKRAGVLQERGLDDERAFGRKPRMLQINHSQFQIVTLNIDKDSIGFALHNTVGELIEEATVYDVHQSYEQTAKRIVYTQSKLLNPEKLVAVCVLLPAAISEKTGKIISTVLHKGEKDLIRAFRDAFCDETLIIGNQSAFYAYGEYAYAKNNEKRNLLYVSYGYGIGAGIISNGEMFCGADGMAGEIGHTSLDINGPICSCGSRGCMESIIGLNCVHKKINLAIREGSYSILEEMCKGRLQDITPQMIGNAFQQNDRLAVEVVDFVIEGLAHGLNNVVNILNPSDIIVGGYAQMFGVEFLKKLKENLIVPLVRATESDLDICFPIFQHYGANMGAATYILEKLFCWSESKVVPEIKI